MAEFSPGDLVRVAGGKLSPQNSLMQRIGLIVFVVDDVMYVMWSGPNVRARLASVYRRSPLAEILVLA